MSDTSETSSPTPPAIELLLKAVRTLTPDEQDIVLGHLLSRTTLPASGSPAPGPLPTIAVQHSASARAGLAYGTIVPIATKETELRTVPIRFPLTQYDRLKQWCEDNNFPMAVVVRGLVERFLEQQSHAE